MYTLIPYHNSKFIVKERVLFIDLPWIKLEFDLLDEQKEQEIASISSQLGNAEYTNEAVQKFLHELSDYPICYIGANKNNERDNLFSNKLNYDELHKKLKSDYKYLNNARELLSLQPILNSAYLNDNLYDPLTCVTLFIANRLEVETSIEIYRQQLIHSLELLRTVHEDSFFEFIALLYKQTYYITTNVAEILPLGSKSFEYLKTAISNFLKEEAGHNKLMSKSLSNLGYSANDDSRLYVMNVTKDILALFKFAAIYSPLAFTSFIGLFEGSFYPQEDPIVACINKSSKPEAAFGYKKHFDINVNHSHKDEIIHFAKCLPNLPLCEVKLAANIFELALHLIGRKIIELNSIVNQHLLNTF
jgi:hypothetical protein